MYRIFETLFIFLSVLFFLLAISNSETQHYAIIILFVISVLECLFYNIVIYHIVNKEHKERNRIRNKYHKWMSRICYSVRSPIHTIQIVSEKLNDGSQQINLLKATSDHLSDIINSYIDFINIETQISIKKSETNIIQIIEEILERYSILNSKNINIETNFNINNSVIYTDPLKIRQILNIILNNSMKFTPVNGTISISVSKLSNYIEVKIKDTGPGFKTQPNGLGIIITKYTANALGGNVSLKNRNEISGAEFTLTIPDDKPIQSPNIILPRMFSDTIVYVYEDNSSYRFQLRDMFIKMGMLRKNVKIFSESEELIEQLKIKFPHIILIETNKELYTQIQNQGYTGSIITTSRRKTNQEFELKKPYTYIELKECVEKTLNFYTSIEI